MQKRMMKKGMCAAMLLLLSSIAFASTLNSMTKDETVSAFSNKTISTITDVTLNGNIIADKFTGYFSKDGKITGQMSKKPADGPKHDQGTWKAMDDGSMCFKWNQWDNNKEKCVNFYQLDNAILVVNTSNGFETLILNKDIKSGNSVK